MGNSNSAKEFHEVTRVNNLFFSWIKKIWQRVFVSYEIWWWSFTLIVFIWTMFANLQYLPVLMPDAFPAQNIEKTMTPLPNLTVFYPGRIVSGHEYKLDISFKVPDNLPEDTEKVLFQLNSELPSVKLEPSSIEFSTEQTGWIVQQVTLKAIESETRHEKVNINVVSPQFSKSQNFDIFIVNRSYSNVLFFTFIITFGAVILKFLSPLLTHISDLIKKRFSEKAL
jgi:hypothetical protein